MVTNKRIPMQPEGKSSGKRHTQSGVLDAMALAVEQAGIERGFSPNLGWSHYRALMNVEHQNERLFYEIEAENEGWEVKHLKRQIHTFLFARLLKSRDKKTVMELACQGQRISTPAEEELERELERERRLIEERQQAGDEADQDSD